MYSYIPNTEYSIDNICWNVNQCQLVSKGQVVGNYYYGFERKEIKAKQTGYIVILVSGDRYNKDCYVGDGKRNIIPLDKDIEPVAYYIIYDSLDQCIASQPNFNKYYVEYRVQPYWEDLSGHYVKKNDCICKLLRNDDIFEIVADRDGFVCWKTTEIIKFVDSEDDIKSQFSLFVNEQSFYTDEYSRQYLLPDKEHFDNFDFNDNYKNVALNTSSLLYIFHDLWKDRSYYPPFTLKVDWHRNHCNISMPAYFDNYTNRLMFCIPLYRKEFNLKIKDKIELYFSNSKVISYSITETPQIVDSEHDIVRFEIFKEDLDIFCNEDLMYTKVITGKNQKEKFYTNEVLQFERLSLLRKVYAKRFAECFFSNGGTINNISLTTQATNTDMLEGECYVYLMLDTKNHYHKIGISKNPTYREKTLQGDKPSIIKLAAKKYPSRKIAGAIESALHEAFTEKHVRGEWFNLNDEEVNMIIDTLV